MTPDTAVLVDPSGARREVPVAEVRVGDARLVVRPGETGPVDGEVVCGSRPWDDSSVTGEAFPRPGAWGDEVLAGTLSYNGVI
jgi:cation transport ATPase